MGILQPMAKHLLYLLYVFFFWFVAIAPPPPRRAPSTALSMRSKSMTSELEDLGKHSHGKQKHLIQCLVLLNTFLEDKGPFTLVVFLHFVLAVTALHFG